MTTEVGDALPLLRPTWAEVNLGAIRRNVQRLKALGEAKGVGLIAVVKADAYGHGAPRVARTVIDAGATSLAVALPEEGIVLRREGIRAPILVMGAYIPGTAEAYVKYHLTPTVASLEQGASLQREVDALGTRLAVQLKVDTGMGRLGVLPTDVASLVQAVVSADNRCVEIEGVYSHLATADEETTAYARQQQRTFESVLATVRSLGVTVKQRHLLNSPGLLQMDAGSTNLARVGLAVYGLWPSDHMRGVVDLEGAMTLRTRVNGVKAVPQGTYVSYGRRYCTPGPTQIATLPIGYADGMSRRLTGKISVCIGGRRFPVVGTICMDQAMVDVGDAEIVPGDDVVLFGGDCHECPTVDEWARILETINYEVVCAISSRVPRRYVDR